MGWNENVSAVVTDPNAAGVFGALLSLRWVPGPTWVARLFCFGCGIACAIYAAPALVDYLQVKAAWAPRLFSFLFGLLGMNLIAKSVEIIQHTDWVTVASSFRSSKP